MFFFAVGQVTGRGCSTKDKVFYKECETHQYGDQLEIMCFCSYFLCNGGSIPTKNPPNVLTFLWLIILVAVLNKTLNTSIYTQYQAFEGSFDKERQLKSSLHIKQIANDDYKDLKFTHHNVANGFNQARGNGSNQFSDVNGVIISEKHKDRNSALKNLGIHHFVDGNQLSSLKESPNLKIIEPTEVYFEDIHNLGYRVDYDEYPPKTVLYSLGESSLTAVSYLALCYKAKEIKMLALLRKHFSLKPVTTKSDYVSEIP